MRKKLDYRNLIPIGDRINISPRKLEDILFYLLEHPSRQIVLQRTLGLPTSVMRLIRKELRDLLIVERDNYSLNKQYSALVDDLYSKRNKKDEFIVEELTKCQAKLEQIENGRRRSKRGIDQFRALSHTVTDKISFLYKKGELEGRRLMFMGDNDLASIVAAFTSLPESITVFDVDQELLSLINQLSEDYSLNIECVEYDARKKIPERFDSRYHVCVTDPPYTLEGINLFVSRCIQGNGRKNGAIFINYGYSMRSRERALPIQDTLTKMGLLIEEIIPEFGRYYSAQSIGCQSSLYICKMTPKTKPLIRGEYKGENIYTKSIQNE
ncbi:MAG: bis-aminopropyl spermidine synthase family protein [Nanoarchaeota archaeon]|nr:bis-aminopropyl spermidine synthase family protein [Nanoarchaeota archaeon]